MDAGHEILRRADRRAEERLGRPPRTPFAVRAAAIESRRGGCGTRPHRPAFSVVPATFVEQHLGIDLADVRRALATELDPRWLVLGSDERKRAAELAHARGATDAMREPVRRIRKLEVHDQPDVHHLSLIHISEPTR